MTAPAESGTAPVAEPITVPFPRLPLPDTAAPPAETGPDPLHQPDAYAVADAAGTDNLLRCWVRERALPAPTDAELRIPLPASGTEARAAVRYWSPTGHHRFGPVRLTAEGPALTAVGLSALLAREGGGVPAEAADVVARVADSVRRTAGFVAERRERGRSAASDDPELPFLDSEQALVFGHSMHPAPKSREGLSDAECATYSPETRSSFRLHWLAVDASVLATDSAWTEGGRPIGAVDLIGSLGGPQPSCPGAAVLLPLHPWQARDIRHRPGVQALFDAGLLRDLGPHGDPWHPTSSVRTVYRPDAPAMLKLSLGVRITNSRRENLRKELLRGTEVHRLLRSGLAARWHAAHPGFDIVRDPAWLAVDTPDGVPVPGLDVVLRHNPFGPGDRAHCLAGLTSPRPWPGDGSALVLRSRLAGTIDRLAARTGRSGPAVATEWFLRYLDAVVRPLLWLDGEAGIALEAHQQNTLVLLDADGWPCGGRYRDNQGYYFRLSHRADLEGQLPGIGVESDTFVADEVADERLAYYVGINNVFGLVGALGSQRLADERVLLAAFRRFLTAVAAEPGSARRSGLPERLLSSRELRCKANLLTRLHGMDELVGPVDTQSVYVTVPNPLAA
ncbi:IucA/IucC family protein [Streptomyces sp. NRRL F-5123]|uniref:IucA/IucC family protein n=1 Tax=Streptomyces sp. NRRL F-5123 TaxID=1463856 RepID=UPI0005BE9D7C|nr:IucA/IucC family protein [Streptomyces sp. NRRL F-5123]